jgi:hypothetical protein
MDASRSYGERLKEATKIQPGSRRKLSVLLAAKTGNKPESEWRALGKYQSNKDVPSPERGALLAVLTGEPSLALGPSSGERRRVRQEELEERVDEIEAALRLLGPDLEGLANLPRRVTALERLIPARKRRSGP